MFQNRHPSPSGELSLSTRPIDQLVLPEGSELTVAHIGMIRIGAPVFEGRIGRVYAAEIVSTDPSEAMPVALKVAHPRLPGAALHDPQERVRAGALMNEASILDRIGMNQQLQGHISLFAVTVPSIAGVGALTFPNGSKGTGIAARYTPGAPLPVYVQSVLAARGTVDGPALQEIASVYSRICGAAIALSGSMVELCEFVPSTVLVGAATAQKRPSISIVDLEAGVDTGLLRGVSQGISGGRDSRNVNIGVTISNIVDSLCVTVSSAGLSALGSSFCQKVHETLVHSERAVELCRLVQQEGVRAELEVRRRLRSCIQEAAHLSVAA
jgi:hypothetical protein